MTDERRASRRAPISGVRVTYESGTGERVEADVLDVAAGGLFIRTEAPTSVGKRIALDLHVLGESGPWSALGRVVWARAAGEPGRPAGMGVKLIDVDDTTLQAIERLVDTREATAPGVGKVAPVAVAPVVVAAAVAGAGPVAAASPERERTLMGVGTSEQSGPEPSPAPRPAAGAPAPPPSTAPTPPPAAAPAAAEGPAREPSIAIDLVVGKKSSPPPPPVAAEPADEHEREHEEATAPLVPLAAPKEAKPARPSTPPADSGAGAARWVVMILLLVVAGIAAYVLFDGFLRPMGK